MDFGILGFLILFVSVGGICMFIHLCVSRHFPVYVRHTFISFYYFQTGRRRRRVQARAWRRRACAHRRKEFMLQGGIFF